MKLLLIQSKIFPESIKAQGGCESWSSNDDDGGVASGIGGKRSPRGWRSKYRDCHLISWSGIGSTRSSGKYKSMEMETGLCAGIGSRRSSRGIKSMEKEDGSGCSCRMNCIRNIYGVWMFCSKKKLLGNAHARWASSVAIMEISERVGVVHIWTKLSFIS